jgi:hypothetical protein
MGMGMRSEACGNAECGTRESRKNYAFILHSSFFIAPIGLRTLLHLITLAILFWPSVMWSQGDIGDSKVGLTASLDRESAKLGSIVVLTLDYLLPEGGRLPEEVEIKGLQDLTIVGREVEPDQIRIKLMVDRLGSWESGPLLLSYLDEQGQEETLKADPVSLTVLSNLGEKPEEAQLRSIQGIINTKVLWLTYVAWGAGLLCVLVAIAGFLWWRKRRDIKSVSAEVVDPPHVRARREIEELEAQRLFEKGYVKGFYFRFSEILRQYLASLRGFPAAEFTTQEIALCISREEDRRLLSLLRDADLVKFADAVPASCKKEDEVKAALSYIRETSENGKDEHRTSNHALAWVNGKNEKKMNIEHRMVNGKK